MQDEKQTPPLHWATALGAALISGVVMWILVDRWWLVVLLVPGLLLALHFWPRLPELQRKALTGWMVAVVLVFALHDVQLIRANVNSPPEWDMRMFWIQGSVAAQGKNFYDAQYATALVQPFNPSEDFLKEIYFWYPPQSMLFFVPLGWFSIETATLIWLVIQAGLLCLTIFLLWRLFLVKQGWIGLIFAAALTLMLSAVTATIALGQINFLVCLLLLLFWRERDRARGGLWLALGIFAKPVLAFPGLYLLIRRRWQSIGVAVITAVVLSILAFIAFGSDTFMAYFTSNPNGKAPDYLYTESVNQSLLATVLRLTHYDFSNGSPLKYPLFIIPAAALLVITLWLVLRLKDSQDELGMGLILMAGLLIYPASLAHYSVLLILPILWLWVHRAEIPGGIWSITVLIALLYALLSYSGGDFTFFAYVLLWLVLAGNAFWLTNRKTKQSAPLSPATAN